MSFSKNCPVCNEFFSSLVSYMEHIKDKHGDMSPESFLKNDKELTF